MVQALLSWGNGNVSHQKLASTRKHRAPVAVMAAAGLLLSVSSVLATDAQPRPANSTTPPSGQATMTTTAQPGPSGAGMSQPMAAPAPMGADVMFRVSGLSVKYNSDISGSAAPSIAQLMNDASVELVPTADGYTVRDNVRGTRYSLAQLNAELARGNKALSQRALEAVLVSLRDAINRRGIVGAWVEFDRGDIEVRAGSGGPTWVDVRQGRTNLNVGVFAAKVGGGASDVRTIGRGERFGENDAINSPLHARIRNNSPVKAGGLLNKTALDDYVLRLNRYPGRNVALAIGASETEGMASLDYIVNETKPWAIYAQISNTGTESTQEWRERIGFYHNQLTGNDDQLAIDYSTAGFSESHNVQGYYEAPLWKWDRLRWQIFGGYNFWDASEVGVTTEDFNGEGYNFGGKLTYQAFQWREMFFDVYTGLKYAHYRVNNSSILLTGESGFLLPFFGASFERRTDTMTTNANANVEFNMPDWGGTETGLDLDALGRADPDRDFVIFSWDLTHSMYLEPLLDGKNFRDGKSTLAHEMYLSFRGQTAFDNRLTPNFQAVAGGLYTVRGYDESEQAGDDSLLFTAEYRLHIPMLFAIREQPSKDFFGQPFRWAPQETYGRPDWDLIFRGFVDVGHVSKNNALSFESDETLVGVGIGGELQLRRNVNVRLDLGFPLDDTPRTESGSPKLHFVATLLF